MNVEEDISFDPSVRAVQIEEVIATTDKDIIKKLNNWFVELAITAREIDDIVIAGGRSKETLPNDTTAAGPNAPRAVHGFKGGCRRREVTAAN